MRNVLVGLISAAAVLSLGSPANATPSICDAIAGNLVQNCGFELPHPPNGLPPDWNASGGFMFVTNGSPNSGFDALDIGAEPPDLDVLSQVLTTTTAGTHYTLSWYYHFSGGTPGGLTVLWDGSAVYTETDHSSLAGYALFSVTVTGTGNDTLEFDAYDAPSFDYLDDVSVVEQQATTGVPEPLTLSLFGAGLAGAAALRRRKKSN